MKRVRPIKIEGALAYITLTRGYVAVIDAADVYLINDRNWCARPRKNGVIYAQSSDWNSCGQKTTVSLHSKILGERHDFIDHKDRDGLNCRRRNLRPATRSQNSINCKISLANSSGYKGVSFCKRTGRWQAYIGSEGRRKYLGRFNSREDAFEARWKAAIINHGQFARLS